MKRNGPLLGLVLIFIGTLYWIQLPKEIILTGETMGTTYTVKAYPDRWTSKKYLQSQITRELNNLTDTLSTYDNTSELSKWNNSRSTDWEVISDDLFKVIYKAKQVFFISKGAFDPTVKPLSDLWGFSQTSRTYEVPEEDMIARAMAKLGFNKVDIAFGHKLRKKEAMLRLDLSGLAKGYGVDQIADYLTGINIKHYFVEIGGEIRVKGLREHKYPWKVGINTPSATANQKSIYKQVFLRRSRAIATSGDYRNYMEINGKRYSHIINPRTGYPTESGIVSATVLTLNCMAADALATALMVMSPQEGLAMIERLPDTEAMVIIQDEHGNFADLKTKRFP